MIFSDVEQLSCKVLAGEKLDRREARRLAVEAELDDLLYWANRLRRARFGDEVKFCAIGSGKTGACSEDCKWCAQSAHYDTHVPPGVQRTSPAELRRLCARARGFGASRFSIVNSGRRPSADDLADVCETAAGVRADGGVAPCASLGELDAAAAAMLAAGGVERYHHNLETSRRFYASMVTTHAFDDRLATLATARRAGMAICSGGLFGLGETWDDRIDLALTLRDEVGADVTPLNFLHRIPGTPLADATPLEPRECLRIIALFRFILPTADVKVAGGREVNLRDLASWMFFAGATSCMVGAYLTTDGRDGDDDRRMVADLGLRVVDRFSCEGDADGRDC